MPTNGSVTFELDQSANIRPLEVGDQAPAFALPDPDDIVVSSAELLKTGRSLSPSVAVSSARTG